MKKHTLFIFISILNLSVAMSIQSVKVDAIAMVEGSSRLNTDRMSKTAAYLHSVQDIDTLNARLYKEYYGKVKDNSSWLTTQLSDGTWADINYADKSVTYWAPVEHLVRIQQLAKSYCLQADKTSTLSQNLLSGIEKGMNAWFTLKCASSNWWYNEIGQQQQIVPIVVLMRNFLQPATLNKTCAYLIVNKKLTLTNLVWEASGMLVKGVVLNLPDTINKAVGYIRQAIRPVNKGVEGIQMDYSFLVHNLQLYNGGYGVALITDASFWMNMLSGTSYGFTVAEIEPLRKLILEGNHWLIWRGQRDFGSVGRDISRNSGLASTGLLTPLNRMVVVDSTNAFYYTNMINHINGKKNDDLTGNKLFSSADCMVQKRSTYHFSVKMCSTRTCGIESMNGENLLGFWLPFGATCLMKDGNEFNLIYPLWDWSRIPGVTASDETPVLGSVNNQPTSFVGGVSNGQCGAAVMDLNKQNLTAKKAWFMFDKEIVCLGAGINSINTKVINTSIAQNLLRSTVNVDGTTKSNGTDIAYNNAKWVFHDNVCYFFPQPTNILLTNNKKSGTWGDINKSYPKTDSITNSVFNVNIPHGLKPVNASYAYIIYPDIILDKVKAYSDNPLVKVLSNTSSIQAVTQITQKLTSVVFHSAGKLIIDTGLTISVDKPCLLMVDQSSSPVKITAADPTQTLTSVNVSLNYLSLPDEVLNFIFPSLNSSGLSVVKSATRSFFTGFTPQAVDSISTCVSGKKITVHFPPEQGNPNITLTDIMGHLIYSRQSTEQSVEISLPESFSGTLFLFVESNKSKFNKKIFVK